MEHGGGQFPSPRNLSCVAISNLRQNYDTFFSDVNDTSCERF